MYVCRGGGGFGGGGGSRRNDRNCILAALGSVVGISFPSQDVADDTWQWCVEAQRGVAGVVSRGHMQGDLFESRGSVTFSTEEAKSGLGGGRGGGGQ